MRNDIYTKVVLTVIAVMLSVIALRPVVSPQTAAQAQGGFAGLETAGPWDFFDTRTDDLWSYGDRDKPAEHWRVARLGAPLTRAK